MRACASPSFTTGVQSNRELVTMKVRRGRNAHSFYAAAVTSIVTCDLRRDSLRTLVAHNRVNQRLVAPNDAHAGLMRVRGELRVDPQIADGDESISRIHEG